jgi:serine protease Do
MSVSLNRLRPLVTAAVCFAGGVLFASTMDWTPWSYAQSGSTTVRPAGREIKSLSDQSDAFVAIAENLTPAVVAIQTQRTRRPQVRQRQQNIPPELLPFMEQQPPQEGSGSGFVITEDGYIVTNNHVVADADKITVHMNDRKSYDAKLIGRDPQTDVAVLKIDAKGLTKVALGDDERLRVGEWVLAVGNPLGLDFTVTAGIVSAKGRGSREVPVNAQNQWAITDFIQTDAAINPGNSGGPLVNIRGEVIGINSAIASGTGYFTGYGFAIPIGLARLVWMDLIENGRVRRAALGVAINDVSAEDADAAKLKKITGVKVEGCSAAGGDSPACEAGITAGDIILRLDGVEVDRVSGLQRFVRGKKPGTTVTVDVNRFGAEKTFKVKLIEASTETQVAAAEPVAPRTAVPALKLGVEVEAVSADFVMKNELTQAQRGLRVVSVDPEGPAYTKLFADAGDVIIAEAASNKPIKALADLESILASKKAGEVLSLRIYRVADKSTRVVNVRIGG